MAIVREAAKVTGLVMLGTSVVLSKHEHIDVAMYTPMPPASHVVGVVSTSGGSSGPMYVYSSNGFQRLI